MGINFKAHYSEPLPQFIGWISFWIMDISFVFWHLMPDEECVGFALRWAVFKTIHTVQGVSPKINSIFNSEIA